MDEQLAKSGQAAAAYIEHKWGGPTKSTPLTAVVLAGPAPVRALLNNPRRFEYMVFNPSTGNVYWGNSSVDAALNAVLVPPLGGSLIATVDEDGEAVTYEVWLNSPAALTVYVQEVTRK